MIKFGTGGFRAVIGEDFTKENIQILSKALCDKRKVWRTPEWSSVMTDVSCPRKPCSGLQWYSRQKGYIQN